MKKDIELVYQPLDPTIGGFFKTIGYEYVGCGPYIRYTNIASKS